ncbi:Probable RNA-directed DNA polymerase from transposon X-element [Eumeta japonica]|uniref:Probable RNA-directed DNA polymerase from transposon X-element n=1 Tax=Eumeta variegata TaxID=151549 RepID=A0A4C1TMM0_EUMVA|nr:Probable RNA-directed DNA polymerase from transposon X-element [Eumeta japonica]
MRRYATKDRAEILAEHLEKQFIPHPSSYSLAATSHQEEVERRLREFLSAPVPPLPGDYYVFPAETVRIILRLLKQKAPGPDGIPTIAIKQLPRRAIMSMTRLFNGMTWTGHFPGCWKMGRVIAIPKAGKGHRLASVSARLRCCPTSPSCLSAICCDACTWTGTVRVSYQTLYNAPAGVLHYMAAEHNHGRRTIGFFLDIEKAFDQVRTPNCCTS